MITNKYIIKRSSGIQRFGVFCAGEQYEKENRKFSAQDPKNNQGPRVLAAMLMTVMVAASLSGCGSGNAESRIASGTAENEILTLSPVAQDKELVTIHYEYGLNIAGALEQTIETRLVIFRIC